MTLIYSIDLVGTFVFAISGVLNALERKFDIFGVAILAFVAAVGGGTLRDILIGSTPVGWMKDETYVYVILFAIPLSFLFRKYIVRLRKTMFLFDTIGIGLFTVLGMQKSLDVGLSPTISIFMGVITAVFGGVIRDVLSTEVPLIFRKEIYASACFAGAIAYFFAINLSQNDLINTGIAVAVVMAIRILSVKNKWTLAFFKD